MSIGLSHTSKALVLLTLALAALGAICHTVECKSITPVRVEEEDPLIALPSDTTQSVQTEPQYIQYYSHVTPAEQQVVYHQPQGQVLAQTAGQSSVEHKQEPSQVIHANGYEVHDANFNIQRQEYFTLDPNQGTQTTSSYGPDYSGEIVYVDPNSEPQVQPNVEIESNQDRINNEAHSSSLAATILTEVPIRDMPIHVLNKLKKDYGVKVVATREHPGANLVINCDEYAVGGDSPACSKTALSSYGPQQDLINLNQQMQSQSRQQQAQPSGYGDSKPSGADEHQHERDTAQEQPQIPSRPDLSAHYEPEQHDSRESHAAETDEQNRGSYEAKASSSEAEKRPADESSQDHPETEGNQMGFDDQSSADAEESEKHEGSEEYEGRSQRQ